MLNTQEEQVRIKIIKGTKEYVSNNYYLVSLKEALILKKEGVAKIVDKIKNKSWQQA
jgi:hypothetical protein